MNEIISQISDLTPTGILIAVNGCMTVAVTALYRDCRSDRAALWKRIEQLEKHLMK